MRPQERIQVFESLSGASITVHKERLGYLLFGIRNETPDSVFYNIDEHGFITYKNNSPGQQAPARILEDEDKERSVITAATDFLAECNRRIENDPVLKEAELRGIFPRSTYLLDLVPNGNGDKLEYWSVVLGVKVRSGLSHQNSSVEGANVEVIVNAKGQVIGLRSHWRPIRSTRKVEPLPLVLGSSLPYGDLVAGARDDKYQLRINGRLSTVKIQIAYQFQYDSQLIAPYYRITGENIFSEAPASFYSV